MPNATITSPWVDLAENSQPPGMREMKVDEDASAVAAITHVSNSDTEDGER